MAKRGVCRFHLCTLMGENGKNGLCFRNHFFYT